MVEQNLAPAQPGATEAHRDASVTSSSPQVVGERQSDSKASKSDTVNTQKSASDKQGDSDASEEVSTAPPSPPSPPLPTSGDPAAVTGNDSTGESVPAAGILIRGAGGEGGKGGEAGKSRSGVGIQLPIAEFVGAVFRQVPEGAYAAVCSKPGDPTTGGWLAHRVDQKGDKLSPAQNNYINCASFYPGDDGSFKTRKDRFAACHFLMLDDIGTKVLFERLAGFKLSWLIETSPGNFQGGIIFSVPISDGAVATRLLNALIDAGLCDAGARGALNRWARHPVGINGKPKYLDEAGAPFGCVLVEWRPDQVYTPEQIVDGLGLELPPAGRPKNELTPQVNDHHGTAFDADDVLTPKAKENPVLAKLKGLRLHKTPLGSGQHDITCPWVDKHTDQIDSGTAYWEPDDQFPLGGFCCLHSHGAQLHIRQLLEFLGIPKAEAQNKPVIHVVVGELHRVVAAAEKSLAIRGRHYQSGGLIVSISTNPASGDPSIVPISAPALTRELSIAASWERLDDRGNWVRCDPSQRHIGILFDAQVYPHLLALAGLARQPYFRESDGAIVIQPGYDRESQRFGVFDPKQFPMGETTREAARAALTLIRELLKEFSFVSPTDEAAALAAIFTAVVRVSLAVAPAFHVRASVFGSGKSYLCAVIACFTGPGLSEKVSYPTTSEEATKVILSLLLKNPACVEFDDMDSDWLPHGVINRMLTSEKVTDRILGASKTATVSTRTLILGSGNNVGPIRDMLRRVITINIDPRVETPATLTYIGNPVATVRANRGLYVMAVMTIIEAWRQSGMPRADCESIATYEGAWSDYCRHPLMWLGLPDPATSLLEQVKHDPDTDSLKGLMAAWRSAFGSTATTVRKAVAKAIEGNSDLLDAMREFPVEERGEINRSKLGWLLKKNANRIVGGYTFQQAQADGRTAWRVVEASHEK